MGASSSNEARRSPPVNVDFIRLLFTSPVEEEIAFSWASRLARLMGHQVLKLRPGTTLAEILDWANSMGVDSMDFACVFEPELRMDFGEFLDWPRQISFREMVEHAAAKATSAL